MSEAAVIQHRSTLGDAPGSLGAVLIIDDEAAIRESLETLLELEGYTVTSAASGEEGLARIGENSYDLVLLDLALPDRSGLDLLAEIRHHDPSLSVIMITAYGTVENAVLAMQAGAANFVQKPWDNEKLLADVGAAVMRRRAEEENVQLKRALKQRYNFENIVGKSEPMLKIFDLVGQVAASRSTILLQGESGTGKELIAKAIHLNSPRKDRPFVPVNTGSMPPDLLESTLFGHVKGAFTSAIASKKGLFEVADRGTLFLDEIGTMGLDTQSKILRVLQDRKFMHLGGIHEIQVDVRIIAATNVDLRQHVREGKFREDLFYRLNVISIDLPPLRQRKEDIPLLVDFFLARYSEENERPRRRITPEGLRPLLTYSFPGNVRELENVVERAVVLSSGSEIGPELLPDHIAGRGSAFPMLEHRTDASLFDIMEDCERHIIIDMLEKCNWNQTEAAEQFRVPLSTLNQKIKRLNIEIKKKGRE
ncbi:MAG: DNA-binding response regulator [Acidobacteria bacterium]|jgi:DNA-binding NtrC family response regulator|nr:MAG: DNA-binding response regulator [Acidobacteriota bacterium]PYV91475.1 MAG: DNA-binding response regulator [Acidobacteriota bacterium]